MDSEKERSDLLSSISEILYILKISRIYKIAIRIIVARGSKLKSIFRNSFIKNPLIAQIPKNYPFLGWKHAARSHESIIALASLQVDSAGQKV